MKNNYDVVVVGAGPAGIMACYELYLKQPELNVLLIDKGQDVMKRHCPIKEKKIKSCPIIRNNEPGCLPACSITAGFGGAGAYSDGKLILHYPLSGDSVWSFSISSVIRLFFCSFSELSLYNLQMQFFFLLS